SPLFIVFFMINNFWSLLICIGLFTILEITDLLDGRIARKYGQITDFGKLMDPYADSIARFTIFLSFLSADLAPLWVIAIFFYRDVLVSVIRVFSIKEGVVIAARKSGKTKAWVQALGISLVLILLLLQKTNVYTDPLTVFHVQLTAIIIFLAALVTLWSAVDYWNGNKAIVLDAMRMKKVS
ncbi:MAG: CDP-diacylglycerol--glycerol-3-phosphate 3-phosphatidyltransferase, partial [Actinobacteria bacterium]|nr:CDP-diacylglycerol--glycerol-3-phosphate 3-phosphatidyltransferase [Actinomycetota bacterium]